jgi:hypothetical protein
MASCQRVPSSGQLSIDPSVWPVPGLAAGWLGGPTPCLPRGSALRPSRSRPVGQAFTKSLSVQRAVHPGQAWFRQVDFTIFNHVCQQGRRSSPWINPGGSAAETSLSRVFALRSPHSGILNPILSQTPWGSRSPELQPFQPARSRQSVRVERLADVTPIHFVSPSCCRLQAGREEPCE